MSGLQGIGGILDDLIITGSNAERHLSNLEGALERMSGMGIKLKNNLVPRVFRLPTRGSGRRKTLVQAGHVPPKKWEV